MSKASQRGNVLFLILIAVALFAALSYVVTQSTRSGSGSIDKEDISLKFNQVQSHATNLRTALNRLLINGFPLETVSFEFGMGSDYANPNCTGNACQIFHPQGGGAVLALTPPEGINDGSPYYISGFSQVDKIGMTNIADPTTTDLILIVPNISEKNCRLINSFMHDDIDISPPNDTTGCLVDTAAPNFYYKGTFVGGNTIEDTAFPTKIDNTWEKCVRCADGKYHYYNVLLSR